MDGRQKPGTCSPGRRVWRPEPRTQDVRPVTQDPQNGADDLELTIEDLGPDTCDHGLSFT